MVLGIDETLFIVFFMKDIKFYVIVASAILLISLFVALIVYCVKNERKIKELEKETQAQQITIETNNKLLEKQQAILKQNQQLQKKLQAIENNNKKEQEQIKKTLQEADLIEEKQALLNSLWD